VSGAELLRMQRSSAAIVAVAPALWKWWLVASVLGIRATMNSWTCTASGDQ